jgi:hypothetical protein
MSRPVNLASPEFEPTDEELIELSRRAFAHVGAAQDASAAALRDRIEARRKTVLAQVHAELSPSAAPLPLP